MSAAKKAECCNLCITHYDGAFDVVFDCPGECKFNMADIMVGGEMAEGKECLHRGEGQCQHRGARITALERFERKLKKEIKRTQEEMAE